MQLGQGDEQDQHRKNQLNTRNRKRPEQSSGREVVRDEIENA